MRTLTEQWARQTLCTWWVWKWTVHVHGSGVKTTHCRWLLTPVLPTDRWLQAYLHSNYTTWGTVYHFKWPRSICRRQCWLSKMLNGPMLQRTELLQSHKGSSHPIWPPVILMPASGKSDWCAHGGSWHWTSLHNSSQRELGILKCSSLNCLLHRQANNWGTQNWGTDQRQSHTKDTKSPLVQGTSYTCKGTLRIGTTLWTTNGIWNTVCMQYAVTCSFFQALLVSE